MLIVSSRYVKNQFQPASTTSTVGASFLTKRVVDDESDTVVRLQIWDTAGQERFRLVISPFSSKHKLDPSLLFWDESN
jgi:GTPase SAR1 family protein